MGFMMTAAALMAYLAADATGIDLGVLAQYGDKLAAACGEGK